MTTADQLASVRSLINKIEAAGTASYSEAGNTFTYQNLPALYARETQLLNRLRAESGPSFALIDPICE
jgi:hypothetical protein